jgi:hypothetical protein
MVIAALAALPASALAAGETITVTPSDVQAGGSPTVTTTLAFDSSQTPQTLVTNLAPGLLSNLNANPSCLVGSPQFTDACDIGTATIDTVLNGSAPLTVNGALYLVAPPSASDIAGIDVHVTSPTPLDQVIGVSFNPSAPGALMLTSSLPNSVTLGTTQIPLRVTGLSTTFNATLNGQPFNRLPTSCSAATSTLSVTYQGGATGSGSDSFTPTGCSGLPYAPNLTAAISVDSSTGGAEVKTDVTQSLGEAASKAITITFPSGLTPNAAALVPCLSGTTCTIGTATASSPLVPGTLSGTVTLGGSPSAPSFAITFPAPVNLTINGVVNLSNNSVTFSDVPDVPLTDLSLDITGVNGQRAFLTDCKTANVTGSFTGQGGQTHSVTAPITFSGQCPPSIGTGTGTGTGPMTGTAPTPKPKASGSLAGLASGHPELNFKVTDAHSAKITSVAIGLPGGLKFSRPVIVSHKTCTKKGKKKKCTTSRRVKGLGIAGVSAKTVALKAGRLVITLKQSATSVTIAVAGPLVTESKSLKTKAKKHKAGTLRFRLNITTAPHMSTTLTLNRKTR